MSGARFRFDVLAKAVEGVQERTVCGALVTVASISVIAMLVMFEVNSLFTLTAVHHIGVDDGVKPFASSSRDKAWTMPESLAVSLKMTFGHVACDALSLEVDAARGPSSEPIDSVDFRAPTPNELDGWAAQDDPDDACTLDGQLTIAKVSAHFYVEVNVLSVSSKDGQDLQKTRLAAVPGLPLALASYASQIAAIEKRKAINISHKIHSLHFGDRLLADTVAPLDRVVNAPDVAGQQHYLLKVIPTVVETRRTLSTNQYSLAEQFIRYDAVAFAPGRASSAIGVFFYYDFFPVMIQVVERRPSLAQFLVSICAIVGGVFALSSIIDGIIFRGAKVLSAKHD